MVVIWHIEKLSVFLLIIVPVIIVGRKHHLHLKDDYRRIIPISTFGYFKGGKLTVQLFDFVIGQDQPSSSTGNSQQLIGFTVDRTLNDGLNPYSQNIDRSYCPLSRRDSQNTDSENFQRLSRIFLIFNTTKKTVEITCSPNLEKLTITPITEQLQYSHATPKKTPVQIENVMIRQKRRKRRSPDDNSDEEPPMPILEQSPKPNVPQNIGPDNGKPSSEKPIGPKVDSSPNGSPSESIPQKSQPLLEKDASVNNESKKKDTVDPPKQPAEENVPNPDLFAPSENPSKDQQVSFSDPALAGNGWPTDGGQNCGSIQLPLIAKNNTNGPPSYSTGFTIVVPSEELEGLYNLYFHNCLGEDNFIDLNVSYVEQNEGNNYLSAGEMPLPGLYFIMSIVFFMAGCLWVYVLKKSKSGVSVFKIHYLMGALMYLKSLSLLFHAINYHYIQTEGTPVEGFAVLYYTVHLLKGAVLFITILLIGTGYAFVKHLLSDKDKKIFMIVIPLQVLANVADIIIEESEEGEIVHTTWKVIFISLDLLCCGAILFPVVWSIRHLQEASRTDGKAATNLRKLKLFRQFYIIVVCYIYFTRIIVNLLLKITIPFQYEWLDEMFLELTTFIFFVLTGYKFRPAANNPYLELAHDSDDETDIALTESGLTEGVSKRGGRVKKKTLKEIVLFDPNDDDTDDDEEVLLETSRSRV